MRKLIEFIRSVYVAVLFVVLEALAVSYYAHSTHYTQARLLARSNQLAGGVHGMVVLFCSVRHRGKSLAYIASQEIDTTTGRVAAWAVLAILLLTLAGLSIAVVNAMHNSLWSTYTVFCTIPIAVLMGLYMQVWRKGDVRGATIMGVVLLFLCILSGPWVCLLYTSPSPRDA